VRVQLLEGGRGLLAFETQRRMGPGGEDPGKRSRRQWRRDRYGSGHDGSDRFGSVTEEIGRTPKSIYVPSLSLNGSFVSSMR
jgi:hypothetical protein